MSNSNIQRLNSTNVMSSTTIHNGIVYLSGQIPKINSNCIKAQTLNVLETIDSLLVQANSNRNNILNAQIFLRNIEDFSVFNEVWIDWLNGYDKPSRATIQAVLANPEWLIEIAIIATQR
ncbi:RidA family protein [Acinetobacter radioresistens]|uniref:RidA family protein n=1 Tax=Acinetobacter radioresistens TaxID=40216 RepID=UPI0009463FE1|nr:RidA family protein [Acinetobacter radioresistens]